jgi:hypothetical protein
VLCYLRDFSVPDFLLTDVFLLRRFLIGERFT